MLNIRSKDKLEGKRYCCAYCGYTWIEYVGLIIESREGEDIHLRIGNIEPECQKCGCSLIYEISPPKGREYRFEDIEKIVKKK